MSLPEATSLLKQRNFMLLWLGQAVSIFGTRLSELALPWIVLSTTGSPLQAGLVALCSQAAPLVLALPVGAWIEKHKKRSIALWAEVANAAALGSLALAAYAEILEIWMIAVALLLKGLAGLLFKVSTAVMIPAIVGRNRLIAAHNYIEGADALSTLSGPAAAGVVFAALGAAWVLALDALTFVVSFLALWFMQFREELEPTEAESPSQRLRDALQGLKYLIGNGIQRLFTFYQGALNFCTISVELLAIILAQQTLELNIAQTGVLLSAAGLGNIVGVLLLDKVKDFAWGFLLTSVLVTSGIGVVVLATATNYFVALLGMFLFDGALSMAFVISGSLRQAITPDRLLARAGSAWLLVGGSLSALGSIYAGGVAEFFGARLALLLCGLLLFLGAGLALTERSSNKAVKDIQPIELPSSESKRESKT